MQHQICFAFISGSFKVLDADLNELASFHHRKEEISDVKFSPSKLILITSVHTEL